MYLPSCFSETRPEVLEAFMRAHPLGWLVTLTAGRSAVDLVPMLPWHTAAGGLQLRGHVARANPVSRELPAGAEVLVVFGGSDHYVTPSWYASKPVDGRVVPTWNYSIVQVRGALRWFDDSAALRELVTTLTATHEAPRAQRWEVSDAPDDYIAGMLRAIVGFEIEVATMVGKFKSSQNRDDADRAGVAAGLAADGVAAEAVAELVRDPERR